MIREGHASPLLSALPTSIARKIVSHQKWLHSSGARAGVSDSHRDTTVADQLACASQFTVTVSMFYVVSWLLKSLLHWLFISITL